MGSCYSPSFSIGHSAGQCSIPPDTGKETIKPGTKAAHKLFPSTCLQIACRFNELMQAELLKHYVYFLLSSFLLSALPPSPAASPQIAETQNYDNRDLPPAPSPEGQPSLCLLSPGSPALHRESSFYVSEKNREVASSPRRQPQINYVFESLGSRNKRSGFGPHLACRRVLFGLVECLEKRKKNQQILHKSLGLWHLLKVC